MGQMARLTPMLQATDLAATLAFYTEILGFQVESLWPMDRPEWCALRLDGARVMFMVNDHLGSPTMTGVLYIETSDVLELHARLAGKVEVLWGPEEFAYGMLEFAIKDCHGYLISFGQPVGEADAGSAGFEGSRE